MVFHQGEKELVVMYRGVESTVDLVEGTVEKEVASQGGLFEDFEAKLGKTR